MTPIQLDQLIHQLATDSSGKLTDATPTAEEYIEAMKRLVIRLQSFIDAIEAMQGDTYA